MSRLASINVLATPLPIASALCELQAALNPHEERDRLVEVFHATLRCLGGLAFAARLERLARLRRQAPPDREWVGLTRDGGQRKDIASATTSLDGGVVDLIGEFGSPPRPITVRAIARSVIGWMRSSSAELALDAPGSCKAPGAHVVSNGLARFLDLTSRLRLARQSATWRFAAAIHSNIGSAMSVHAVEPECVEVDPCG